jgi:NADPH-dependent curcumin reductase CurA
METIAGADLLAVDSLKIQCAVYLASVLDMDNVFDILDSANRFSMAELAVKCCTYLIDRPATWEYAELKALTTATVRETIKSVASRILSGDIFKFLNSWRKSTYQLAENAVKPTADEIKELFSALNVFEMTPSTALYSLFIWLLYPFIGV